MSGMMSYCAKLTGEGMSRYLNKIKSEGLRKLSANARSATSN